MNKLQAIVDLQKVYEATLASDFGSALAETPEEALEIAARETLGLTITMLKASITDEPIDK